MAIARYHMLVRYNKWANERIYEVAATLSDTDYRRDLQLYFKSVHATLNHLLVADRLWMARFTGAPMPSLSLDSIIHDDFSQLLAARRAEDDAIIAFVDGLNDAALNREFSYRTVTNPVNVTQPLAPALDHFLNHQTHHRGQIHAALTRLTGTAPSLDLIVFQRQSGLGGTKTSS